MKNTPTLIPENIIANADDFGLNSSVNKAILHSYEQGYINSTSLMANCIGFEEAVAMSHQNKIVQNIGVHINLAEGKPVTDFKQKGFLTPNGEWDIGQTGKKLSFLSFESKAAFYAEIETQLSRVLKQNVPVTHLDSHLHLHTLPCFFELFLSLARTYKLKLRLAQSFNEGSPLKFLFRQFLNRKIKQQGIGYSSRFQTVDYFINHHHLRPAARQTEIMLHPDFDQSGNLTDHYLPTDMADWLLYLKTQNEPR